MVRRYQGFAAALAAAMLVALAPVSPVRAHGENPRIEVDAQRLSPGASLSVRGYDFAYETAVELTLVGESQRTLLASLTADVEGAFIHTIALPVGVAVGAYVVEAESGEHVVSGPPMLISGTPMTPDDQDTRFEEGDSLLAPMPTPAVAGAAPEAAFSATPGDDGSGVPTLAIIVIGGLVVVACASWALDRRRRTQHPQHSAV